MYNFENGIVKAKTPENGFKLSLKAFFILAFILSWLGAIPMVGGSWVTPESPDWFKNLIATLAPLQLLMFFGTLIAAFIAAYLNYGKQGLKEIGKGLIKFKASPIAWGIILFAPGLLCLIALLLANLVDPTIKIVSLNETLLITFSQALLIQLILNTEEIAWRGYALPQMQSHFTPFKANLYLAIIWGVFHLPLFLMAGGHPGGNTILIFSIMIIPTGLIFGYSFNKLGGSIILVHLLHQSFNAWGESLRVFPIFHNGSTLPMVIMVFGVCLVGFWIGKKLLKQN